MCRTWLHGYHHRVLPGQRFEGVEKLQAAYPSAKSRISALVVDWGTEEPSNPISRTFSKKFQAPGTLDHIVYTAGDPLAIMPFQSATLEAAKQAGMLRVFGPMFVAKYAAAPPALGPQDLHQRQPEAGFGKSPIRMVDSGNLALRITRRSTWALAVELKTGGGIHSGIPGAVDTPL